MPAMTSRERVCRCVEFTRPDRPPRDLWLQPASSAYYGQDRIDALRRRWPGDIEQCFVGRPAPMRVRGDAHAVGQFRDDWGCVFENLKAGFIGEVRDPILEDLSRLDLVQPPEELLQVDAAVVNDFCRRTDMFVLASGWSRPFERMQFLRGSENLFYDIAEETSDFYALRDKVHDFFLRQFEIWSRTEIDALVIMDDWGAQHSLLISPDQWRRLFKPLYADYGRIARESGKKLFMHSDGYIADIYEDLIEVGVDAINSQIWCMDIEALGRQVAGRIAFWGQIDAQFTLPNGTREDVRRIVADILEHLATPDGGSIAQFAFYPPTPYENAEAAYEAWDELTCAPSR